MKKEKTKWELKRERLEGNPNYARIMRRIEKAEFFERMQFERLRCKHLADVVIRQGPLWLCVRCMRGGTA